MNIYIELYSKITFLRWLSTFVKKQQRKRKVKIFAIFVKWGFFGSRNACIKSLNVKHNRLKEANCVLLW